MDILGEHRDGGPGAGGGGIVLEMTSYGATTGGAGTWSTSPSPPATVGGSPVEIDVETLAADSSGNGSLELIFDATGSPTGVLNWSLDSTLFISPATFGPPEEWAASIPTSDSTSPGSATVLIEFASTNAFEAGLQLGVKCDDGVNLPFTILVNFNHTETP